MLVQSRYKEFKTFWTSFVDKYTAYSFVCYRTHQSYLKTAFNNLTKGSHPVLLKQETDNQEVAVLQLYYRKKIDVYIIRVILEMQVSFYIKYTELFIFINKYIDILCICFSVQKINSVGVFMLSTYLLSSIRVPSEIKNRCNLSDSSNSLGKNNVFIFFSNQNFSR